MLEFRIDFEIIREIKHSETIARGSGIRELNRLRKIHGPGNWRKRKGYATVRLPDGSTCIAEIHWYEQGCVVYVCLISDLKLPHIKLSIAKLSTWAERTPLDPEEQEGNHKLNNIL